MSYIGDEPRKIVVVPKPERAPIIKPPVREPVREPVSVPELVPARVGGSR